VVGYSAIMWVFLGWYAGIKIGYGKYRWGPHGYHCRHGLGWATGLVISSP
jgi:AGZA family xanthine/uracil permease-like MFS transporter